MQFLLTAYDGTDDQAAARRAKARPGHLELSDRMVEDGSLLYAAAVLDNAGAMIGSMMVVEFGDRGKLDGWLSVEPYATEGVWHTIDVKPCRPGPRFRAPGGPQTMLA